MFKIQKKIRKNEINMKGTNFIERDIGEIKKINKSVIVPRE